MSRGWRWRWGRFLIVFGLALLVGWGQGPVLGSGLTVAPPNPAAVGMPPVAGEPLPSQGAYQLGKVRILGVPVITVASPVISDAGDGPDATTRARVIEGNLEMLYRGRSFCSGGEALAEGLVHAFLKQGNGREEGACGLADTSLFSRPDALTVAVVRGPDGVHRLEARVAGRAEPLPLLTVTPEDARLNGLDNAALAARWQELLQRRLRLARRLMQPAELLRRWSVVALAELVLFVLLALNLWCWARVRRVVAHWEDRFHLSGRSWARSLLIQGMHGLSFGLLLAFSVLLLTMAGVAMLAVPGQVPTALELVLQPWGIAVKLLLVGLFHLLALALLGLWLRQWVGQASVPGALRERRRQRCRSLQRVLRRLVGLLCLLVATVWIVSAMPGVREMSHQVVLLGGALLGGLALVFQGLLRDFVAGLTILFGDAFAIGDTVEIRGLTGEVADLGLLATELRCLDQRAALFPNSLCAEVVNHTKLRSGVLVEVMLSHRGGDLLQALALIRQELEAFAVDPSWQPALLRAPELRGVTAAGPSGITASVLVETVAGAQGPAGREVRLRLLQRLRREGVSLAEED
ncbi:MAG: mechanosensitive ion channel family protein [Cyanobacteriota bacterium]